MHGTFAARHHDRTRGMVAWHRLVEILTSECAVWGKTPATPEASEDPHTFLKLDMVEDTLRRRRRLVANPDGSSHPEAIAHSVANEPVPDAQDSPLRHLPSAGSAASIHLIC